MLKKFSRHKFLFEELVKRDFKKKYKRTVLGMLWSVLSPLMMLLVMRLVFTRFFGRGMDHYTTYLFCGNLVFAFFSESSSQGMSSLMGNAGIFTKVNVPKYLFLLSKNVQCLINFGLTLCVFVLFCVFDGIIFTWRWVFLLYPVILLVVFNIGMGLILSALYVFFRDIQYLWGVFTQLLMYMSAIFYDPSQFVGYFAETSHGVPSDSPIRIIPVPLRRDMVKEAELMVGWLENWGEPREPWLNVEEFLGFLLT